MFLGSTNEKATLYLTGWRSVYCKPTLRYQHVVYQNLAEVCHYLARMHAQDARGTDALLSQHLLRYPPVHRPLLGFSIIMARAVKGVDGSRLRLRPRLLRSLRGFRLDRGLSANRVD